MRILAIADEESKRYYDYFRPGSLDEFDLIISCGDLHPEYLDFLASVTKAPILYVHGNHDERYIKEPPGGCTCIDDDIFEYQGVRFLGLGGSYKYRNGRFMYTEGQMMRRIARLFPKILMKRGFDVLVTHAPARNLNDTEHLSHRGFQAFNYLMEHYHPKYFFHGHVHMNYGKVPRICHYQDTTVINAYEYVKVDLEI